MWTLARLLRWGKRKRSVRDSISRKLFVTSSTVVKHGGTKFAYATQYFLDKNMDSCGRSPAVLCTFISAACYSVVSAYDLGKTSQSEVRESEWRERRSCGTLGTQLSISWCARRMGVASTASLCGDGLRRTGIDMLLLVYSMDGERLNCGMAVVQYNVASSEFKSFGPANNRSSSDFGRLATGVTTGIASSNPRSRSIATCLVSASNSGQMWDPNGSHGSRTKFQLQCIFHRTSRYLGLAPAALLLSTPNTRVLLPLSSKRLPWLAVDASSLRHAGRPFSCPPPVSPTTKCATVAT